MLQRFPATGVPRELLITPRRGPKSVAESGSVFERADRRTELMDRVAEVETRRNYRDDGLPGRQTDS